MSAVIGTSREYQLIRQQELGRMINEMAKAMPYFASQSEPHQGRTPLIPATIDTYEKLALYFARMGVFGDGAYADVLRFFSRNPKMAALLPDNRVATESLELVEQKRDESGFVHQTVPQLNVGNKNNKSEKKPYGADPYSYSKKPSYSADYMKSVLKVAYNGIEKMVRGAFGKIRSIYQSSSGVLRSKKTYEGKSVSSAKGNVVSLDKYRTARTKRHYGAPNSDEDLEKRLVE